MPYSLRSIVLTLAVVPAAYAGRLAGDPGASSDIRDYVSAGPAAPAKNGRDIGDTVKDMATAMADIGQDLNRQQTGVPVQTKEKKVSASLDGLIADLDKACNGGGGGNMNPTKGLKKSILAGGPGGMGDLRDARAGEKQWGALKPKTREQILQSKTDGFPAGYENLLQSYYRRLASEDNAPPAAADRPAGAVPPSAAPSPAAASVPDPGGS